MITLLFMQRERYRRERDKRLRPDGADQYLDLSGPLAHFAEDDPYVAPGFTREALTDEFDVGRDQVRLIELAMQRLAPGGLLVFSTNFRRFQLDESLRARYDVQDISAATIPKDYARDPKIHRCYEIRERTVAGS